MASRKKKANRQRSYAKELQVKECPNCGVKDKHFVPPSLGEPGFFICEGRKPE